MRLTVLGAMAAVLTALVPASAAPSDGCTILTDPAGDVSLNAGLPVADRHMDVRAASVQATSQGLLFRLQDTELTEGRMGEWRLTFGSGNSRLFVGAGRGMWVNVGEYHGTFGFVAGLEGRRATRVVGAFDYGASEIRIEVPYTAFGADAPRRGDTLHEIRLDARETLVNAGAAPLSLVDQASARATRLTGC